MKRLLPLFLLTFLLISCGAPSTPAPTATLIPSATASPTIIPTATSTPEPLPTLDPYAPKEVMNPDTGKMETFTWDKELKGFFTTAHMIDDKSGFDGTWLMPKDEFSDIPKIPMRFNIQEGVSDIPYFHRLNLETPADSGRDVAGQIFNRLFNARFKNGIGGEKLSRPDFWFRLQAGEIPVSFTTPDGETYTWKPGPAIGVDYYVIAFDDADPASHPEFYETKSNIGEGTVRWKTYTREDGTLVIIAAYAEGASVQAGIFNSIESVIENPTLPTRKSLGLGWPLGGWPGNLMYAATKGASCPFFEITDSP